MNYYNKDYGLIDLDALAAYYNDVLGSSFVVKANCLATPLDGSQTPCTLLATRVPFAISDVRSETLSVTLNFRVVWTPEARRRKTINEIKRLLGYQRFSITEQISVLDDMTHEEREAEKTFNCTSFLEMGQPMGVPEIDSGQKVLDLQVSGTILCTDAQGGAVMSNDIVTFARLNETDAPVPLPIIYQSSNDGFNVEAMLTGGGIEPAAVPLSSENKITVQALYLAREFDRQLITGIKNKEVKVLYLTEVFDSDITVSRRYSVLSMSATKQAGAYMQYTLDLQENAEAKL